MEKRESKLGKKPKKLRKKKEVNIVEKTRMNQIERGK